METVAFPSVAPTAGGGGTDLTAVREKVERALAERFGAGPCRATMRAVVVTAWEGPPKGAWRG
jgi:hypothetical protein